MGRARVGRAGRAVAGSAGALLLVTASLAPEVPAEAAPSTCTVRAFTQVSSGHFDLGPTLSGGQIVPAVKDDRTQPARWAGTGGYIFELGPAARRSLPAGLEFIAPAGTPVYLIGGTQTAGVPWLGWNTQHPTILAEAGSEVRMSLQSVRGPGKVAVFTSGSFGQAVGQRVMDNVGGPGSTSIPLNTHAHGNWVFTEPGAYQLAIGFSVRTRSGQVATGSTTVNVAAGVADPARVFSGCGDAAAAPGAGSAAPARRVAAPAQQPAAAAARQGGLAGPAVPQAPASARAAGEVVGGQARATGSAADGASGSTTDGASGPATNRTYGPVGGMGPGAEAAPAPGAPAEGAPAGSPAWTGSATTSAATAGDGVHWGSAALGAGVLAVLLGFATVVYRSAARVPDGGRR